MRTRTQRERSYSNIRLGIDWLRDLVQGSTGVWGERVATRYLERAGMIILRRNWSSARLEADIIGLEDRTLVVVEVKTRHVSLQENYRALGAIDTNKISHLRRLGQRFLYNNGPLCRRFGIKDLRLDALEVYYRSGLLGCRIKASIWNHKGIDVAS